VVRGDEAAFAQNGRTLEDVVEFSDVARPAVRDEHPARVARQAGRRASEPLRELGEEGFGEGQDIDVRAFGTLYGTAFAAAAAAGAVGPVLLGRVFDETGSYESLLPTLAWFVASIALLMLTLPAYDLRTRAQSVAMDVD
jgi:hypothetical protein